MGLESSKCFQGKQETVKADAITSARPLSKNACWSPFLSSWKGQAGYRGAGPGNTECAQNTPSLSNSILVHGSREVMSQLYKPPVRLALCSGRATARGAPTSNLWTKQRIGAVSLKHLNQSVPRYWAYSLSRSPLSLCSLGRGGRAKVESCDCNTHTCNSYNTHTCNSYNTHTCNSCASQAQGDGLLKPNKKYVRLSHRS